VHITRRDGDDLYLTTARHDQQPSVFPWMRHLSGDESKEFVAELIDATYDAAQLDVHANLHRVVVEWRATARILADPDLTAQLTPRLPDEDQNDAGSTR
jgi:hypothetical protein